MLSGLGKHSNPSQPKVCLNGTVVSRTCLCGKGDRDRLTLDSIWHGGVLQVQASTIQDLMSGIWYWMFELRFWVKEFFSHSHSYLVLAAENKFSNPEESIFAVISFWTEFFVDACPSFPLGETEQSFSAFTSNTDIDQIISLNKEGQWIFSAADR